MEAAKASSTKRTQSNLRLIPTSMSWFITEITFAQLRELNRKMFSFRRFPGKLAPDESKSRLVSCCRHYRTSLLWLHLRACAPIVPSSVSPEHNHQSPNNS